MHTTNPFNATEETMLFCIETLEQSHKAGSKLLKSKLAEYRKQLTTEELRRESNERILRSYRPNTGIRSHGETGSCRTSLAVRMRRYGSAREWIGDAVGLTCAIAAAVMLCVALSAFVPHQETPQEVIDRLYHTQTTIQH